MKKKKKIGYISLCNFFFGWEKFHYTISVVWSKTLNIEQSYSSIIMIFVMVSYAYDSNLTPSFPLSIHLINKEKFRKKNKNCMPIKVGPMAFYNWWSTTWYIYHAHHIKTPIHNFSTPCI